MTPNWMPLRPGQVDGFGGQKNPSPPPATHGSELPSNGLIEDLAPSMLSFA